MLKKVTKTVDRQTRDKSHQAPGETEAVLQHKKLREIDNNISDSQHHGVDTPATQLKTKGQAAAKSITYLNETTIYAGRILEKLTQEKHRILELQNNDDGEAQRVLEHAQDEPENRENMSPEESYSPKSVHHRKSPTGVSKEAEIAAEEEEEEEQAQEEEEVDCETEAHVEYEVEEEEVYEEEEEEEEAEIEADSQEAVEVQENEQEEQAEEVDDEHEESEQSEEALPAVEAGEEVQLEGEACTEEVEADLQCEEETEEVEETEEPEENSENLEHEEEANEVEVFVVEEEEEQELKNEEEEITAGEETEVINLDSEDNKALEEVHELPATTEEVSEEELIPQSSSNTVETSKDQPEEKFVVNYENTTDCIEQEEKEEETAEEDNKEEEEIDSGEQVDKASISQTHDDNLIEQETAEEEEEPTAIENTDEVIEHAEESEEVAIIEQPETETAVEQSEEEEEEENYAEQTDEAEETNEKEPTNDLEREEPVATADQDNGAAEEDSNEHEEEEEEEEEVVEEEEEEEEIEVAKNPSTNLAGPSLQGVQALDQPKVAELLFVSRKHINYGNTMPGQIIEESLEIRNRSDHNLVVQIHVDCLNSELNDSDEYVFAIRRSNSNDYNDKHYLIMSPYSLAAFKLALKVPKKKMKESIRGETTFSIQGLNDKISLSMETRSIIPKIISPKALHHTGLKCKVIKVALKNGKKYDAKIPIKNCSELSMTLDFEFFESKDMDTEEQQYDCFCTPSSITLDPEGVSIVNITFKPNYYEDLPEEETPVVKKVLVGRCRDSSLIYSFLILGEIHD